VDKPGDGRCGIADIRRNLFNVECVSIDLRCTWDLPGYVGCRTDQLTLAQ